MPSFKSTADHQLGRDEALRRLRGFLEQVEKEYGSQVSRLESEWVEDVLQFELTTYGFTIKGQLSVEEAGAQVSGSLPLAAAPFRGKIEKSIAQALETALA
ncbi:MAG: polyhydroxyalkanoic acid system family protein [Planctomycetales bacterium]|nr:polyhydroxyalkanoic acid system family protein [Planctomycetales bacterium]